MDTIAHNTRGLLLLWELYQDRILYIATVGLALCLGGWLGSVLS